MKPFQIWLVEMVAVMDFPMGWAKGRDILTPWFDFQPDLEIGNGRNSTAKDDSGSNIWREGRNM